MKFVSIKHHVPCSFEDKPSFVILMSDGKEYISNGCVSVENTESNIRELIRKYDCKVYLDELFNSPSIDMSSVTNASYMFYNSQLTEFNSDMSSVTNASWMFYDSPYKRKREV